MDKNLKLAIRYVKELFFPDNDDHYFDDKKPKLVDWQPVFVQMVKSGKNDDYLFEIEKKPHYLAVHIWDDVIVRRSIRPKTEIHIWTHTHDYSLQQVRDMSWLQQLEWFSKWDIFYLPRWDERKRSTTAFSLPLQDYQPYRSVEENIAANLPYLFSIKSWLDVLHENFKIDIRATTYCELGQWNTWLVQLSPVLMWELAKLWLPFSHIAYIF